MAVGRMLNRWLGVSPGVVAVVAAIVFGMPAYGQRTHPSGGGGGGVSHMGGGIPHPPPRISAPAPRPQQLSVPAPRPQQQQPSPSRPQSVEPRAVEPRNQVPVERSAGGVAGQPMGGQPPGGQPPGGQSAGGQSPGAMPQVGGQSPGGQFQPGGQSPGGVTATRVPHPPMNRRWPLPQGASESDRPPPGQCRVWLNGVPGSRQPAPTSCGQAAKMRTPGSTLIFGDDGAPPSGPQGRSP